MADITMCMQGCKDQDSCYRWTATANEYRQSYSNFAPKDGVCCHYWPDTLQELQAYYSESQAETLRYYYLITLKELHAIQS